MKSVFLNVLKPEIDEIGNMRVEQAYHSVAERLINNGLDGNTISVATGYDRAQIDSIARRLNRTVRWEEA